jgi:membrane protease YdiL (CAAX protease family)
MNQKKNIIFYVALVFGITYPAWITAAVISQMNPDSNIIFPLHLLGGASPFIATIIFLMKTKSYKDYFYRLTNIKETTMLSWLVVCSPMIIMSVAQVIVYQSFNIDFEFVSMGIFYGIGLLFFGPIPEEMGWRGVLFHNLNQISFKKAQVYMTLIWFLWHLPLFFIVGTYQHGLGILTIDFLFFGLNIVFQSLIMGYLYVIGHKNILLPIIFHYFVNLFGEMFTRNIYVEWIVLFGYVAILGFLYYNQKGKEDHEKKSYDRT